MTGNRVGPHQPGDTPCCLSCSSLRSKWRSLWVSSWFLEVSDLFVFISNNNLCLSLLFNIIYFGFLSENYCWQYNYRINKRVVESHHFQWHWSPRNGPGPSAAAQYPSRGRVWGGARGAPRRCPASSGSSRLVSRSAGQPIEDSSLELSVISGSWEVALLTTEVPCRDKTPCDVSCLMLRIKTKYFCLLNFQNIILPFST